MVTNFEESFCGVIAELLTKQTKWRKANLRTSIFQFFVIHCCLFTCHICILFSVSSLPNAFYFVVLVVKMPEMAHDWWNKIILFYSILFYSIHQVSFFREICWFSGKRGSRVVSALASCARGPGFDPRRRRGKFVGPNLLPFVSSAGMT